jgi:hypothetical protein
MKRLISLIIFIALILGLSSAAFAAEWKCEKDTLYLNESVEVTVEVSFRGRVKDASYFDFWTVGTYFPDGEHVTPIIVSEGETTVTYYRGITTFTSTATVEYVESHEDISSAPVYYWIAILNGNSESARWYGGGWYYFILE